MQLAIPTIQSQMPLQLGHLQIRSMSVACPACLTPIAQTKLRGIALQTNGSAAVDADAECFSCGSTTKVSWCCDEGGAMRGELNHVNAGCKTTTEETKLLVELGKTLARMARWGRGTQSSLVDIAVMPHLSTRCGQVGIQDASNRTIGHYRGASIPAWIILADRRTLVYSRVSRDPSNVHLEIDLDEISVGPGLIFGPKQGL